MSVPKFFEFFVPTLKVLSERDRVNAKNLRNDVAAEMHLTEQDKAEMLPSGRQPVYANRIHWSIQYLKNAGLINIVSRGVYTITKEGIRVYREDRDKLDLHYLERYDSFKKFHGGEGEGGTCIAPPPPSDEVTPLEAIENSYTMIRSELSKSIIQAIMDCSPEFFEHLVIDLLIAMGYGSDGAESGKVTGKTGDGGIDGIVNEDKLGFSQVYVQAKRWDSNHTVGSPEVQAFTGALLGKGATKGLFITTAQFSKAARKYVEDQKAVRVVLVDGTELGRLMIDYNVGVSVQKTYTIKKVDSDYFDEQLEM